MPTSSACFTRLNSTKVYFNSQFVDIIAEEIKEVIPHLKKLTTFAVKYIISNYKNYNFLIGNKLELSIVFTNDKYIQQLNFDWRGINQATNVLSMGLFEEEDVKLSSIILLGDIVISKDTVLKESKEDNISFKDHLTRILLHGIVHIFGFDHQNTKEALIMAEVEKNILQQFNNIIKPLTNNYWREN